MRRPFVLLLLVLFAAPMAHAQKRGWGSTWTESRTANDQVARDLAKKLAAHVVAKDAKAAERDLAAFKKQFPQVARTWMIAALVHAALHRYDRALEDCAVALPLIRAQSPIAEGEVYELRAQIHYAMRNYPAARADFEKALSTNKRNYVFANDLAWFLATCPDAQARDGKRAVKLAREACAATGNREAGLLDTLAAAEAESGKFDAAVRDQKRANAAFKDARLVGGQKRLALYQQHQPYREQRAPLANLPLDR